MKQYITIRELAEILGITYMGAHQRHKHNRSMPKRIKIANRWMYDIDDVNEWLESHKQKEVKE